MDNFSSKTGPAFGARRSVVECLEEIADEAGLFDRGDELLSRYASFADFARAVEQGRAQVRR